MSTPSTGDHAQQVGGGQRRRVLREPVVCQGRAHLREHVSRGGELGVGAEAGDEARPQRRPVAGVPSPGMVISMNGDTQVAPGGGRGRHLGAARRQGHRHAGGVVAEHVPDPADLDGKLRVAVDAHPGERVDLGPAVGEDSADPAVAQRGHGGLAAGDDQVVGERHPSLLRGSR
ncbi:hypothetical protein ACQP2K_21175 [Microbispora siamensis]